MTDKTGILLINLGTPDDCHPRAVRRYLTQFLNDPRVIDIHPLLRRLLVNLIIIPLRYKKSAAAYQKIWQAEGSPLLIHGRALQKSLTDALGDHYRVSLGMRYGNPTIISAIQELEDCTEIIVIPLFPQYSSAATGSALEVAMRALSRQWNVPNIYLVKDFYKNNGFIEAYAEIIKTHLADKKIDLLLMSYHGLPERHIHKSLCFATCDRQQTCPSINKDSAFCYRGQCFETSRLIAEQLQLSPSQYRVVFQSRLGKTPWIKPYTDLVLPELMQQGIKNIAVVCPSFVADCLETLEEVNIRLRKQWQDLGGNEFHFIPCINQHPAWVNTLAQMATLSGRGSG